MASHKEGKVQAYAQAQLKKEGFLVRKLAYEGRNGATDLMAVDILTAFIECKDEGKEPEPHQLLEHQRLKAHGALVFVVDSKQQVDHMIRTLTFKRAELKRHNIKSILR